MPLEGVDLPLAVALVSVVGAVALASVGYFIGRRERIQAALADTGVTGRALPFAEVPPRGPARLVAPPASAPVPTSTRPPSLTELLANFAQEHQTQRAAVFDASGLLVRHVGLPPDPRIGAVIGSFARCFAEARASNLLDGDAWVELSKLAGSTVRCRCFDWKGQMLVATVLDSPPRVSSAAERAVLAAAPTMIASL